MDAKGFFCEMGDLIINCKVPWLNSGCIQENAWGKQSPRIKLFDGVFMGNTSSSGRPLNYDFN
jgi:hypothetical protein